MKLNSQPPLRLTPHYSKQLAGYLITTHLVALFVVIALIKPGWLAFSLAALTLFSLIRSYRCHLSYRGKNVIRSAELGGQNEWLLQQADGEKLAAELQPNSYIHPRLSVLNFRNEYGKRQSLIVLPDGIDGECFRRLRVRLKLMTKQP